MTRSGVFVRLVVLLTALGPAAMDVSAADGEATILNLPGHVTTDGIGLASRGQLVVVAWQATVMTADAEGGSQLFIARSHDGGATFEAPQRINRGAGFSAGGGEQAPRPLFVSDQELLVVWRASRDKQDVEAESPTDHILTRRPTAADRDGTILFFYGGRRSQDSSTGTTADPDTTFFSPEGPVVRFL